MKNKILYFIIIFYLSNNTVVAQFKCAADEAREKLIGLDANYKKSLQQMDAGINAYIKAHPPDLNLLHRAASLSQYYIPCVVHVIYDGTASDHSIGSKYNPSAAQITGAINYINKVYDGSWTGTGGAIIGAGDLQIKLVLATRDPNNNITTGIDRVDGSSVTNYSTNGVNAANNTGAEELNVKNVSRWDPERYYNICLVNKIDGCDGYYCGCSCDAGFIAGYAYFPIPNNSLPAMLNLDGTMMLASQMSAGQKTLPHELGHALNLYHPFQGNNNPGPNTCPPATNTSGDGDLCTDTDPINNPYLAPNATAFACRTGTNPCTGNPYNDNTEKNYMNYTNCYQLFTNGQKARMQGSLNTTQRASLATSWANNQNPYPAPFVAPKPAASTPVSSNLTNDIAGILNISLSNNTIFSLNATEDGGYLDNSTKWYDALQLSPGITYTLSVTILNNGYNSQLGVWIDYDNNGIFNSAEEQIYLQNSIVSGSISTTVNINFTTPANWTGANNFVRMRITDDIGAPYASNINNNSASLNYGQTEDYPLYLNGTILPIVISYFDGFKESNDIRLNWTVEQTIHSKLINLERSLNGAPFKSIKAYYPSTLLTEENFQYKDAAITTNGDYLYRLQLQNKDDSFSYSKILKFTIQDKKVLTILGTNFTNNINMILPYNNGKASFQLMDAAGKTMYAGTLNFTSNYTTIPLPNNSLATGIYFLKIIINGEFFTQKIVKK